MKILMICDTNDKNLIGEKISRKLLSLYAEGENIVSHYDVTKEQLQHCRGCFMCWIKTPGICIFGDVGSQIAKDYVQNDVVIFISPVKYGCYSVAIRRVMDRLLPDILPFFRKVNDEMHHVPRYAKYPDVVVIGYGEEISEFEIDTFKSLADANAINFMKDSAKTYVCRFETDVERTIDSLKHYLTEKEVVGV